MAPDSLLGGRYRLAERLAVGGMGDVWRARDEVLGRDVAVKVLKAEYADDPEFLRRFRDEARHTAALSHPGIAAVHDYADSGEDAFLVMELVDGEPLSAVLAREGRLDVGRTLDLLAQGAAALQAAHDAGVVHRDVKPGNLLVRPDGTLKVTDFGIAKVMASSGHTMTGTILGTAYYLSPEQSRGEPATPASDVYALGLVGYEALSGRRPFTGTDPLRLARAHQHDVPPPLPPDVPPDVVRLVLSAMAKDPTRRPASAAALGADATALRLRLTADQETAPQPAPTAVLPIGAAPVDERVSWSPAAYPDQRQVRRMLLLIGTVVVIVGLVALVAVVASGDGRPVRTNTSPSPRPPSAAPVTISAEQFVGRPAEAVMAELRAQGLVPRVTAQESEQAAGTVIGVQPVGALSPGSTVTVIVATPPVDEDGEGGRGNGKGKGGDD